MSQQKQAVMLPLNNLSEFITMKLTQEYGVGCRGVNGAKQSWLFTVLIVYLIFLFASQVQAAVVTFDDLDTATFGSKNVPFIYQGLAWGDGISPAVYAINDSHWTGAGNYNNPGNDSPSGENLVFNNGIVSVTQVSGAAFDFVGAYFAPFTSGNDINSQGSTAFTVLVEGLNAGVVVDSASVNFQQAGFVWLQADIHNITQVRISGLNPAILPFQTRWAMDNFTYIPAVPAPPSLWVLAAGLVLITVRRIAAHK